MQFLIEIVIKIEPTADTKYKRVDFVALKWWKTERLAVSCKPYVTF